VGEDTNQIEREIRERRTDLGRNLSELEDKARQLADWRTYYRDHPRVFLGAAIGAGIVLALTTVPRAKPKSADFDMDDAEAMPEPDTTHNVFGAQGLNGSEFEREPEPQRGRNGTIQRVQQELGQTWEHIATGLLHLASAKAVQMIGNLVPGFNDYVEPPHRPVNKAQTLH